MAFKEPAVAEGQTGDIQLNTGGELDVVPASGFKYDSAGNKVILNDTKLETSGFILEEPALLTNDFEDNNISPFTTIDFPPIIYGWSPSTTNPYAGTYSAKSGLTSDGSASVMDYTHNLVGSLNAIQFAYRVSCDVSDRLDITINSIVVDTFTGDTGWVVSPVYFLTKPVNTIQFAYIKDGATSALEDAAYIDDVKIYNLEESLSANGLTILNDSISMLGTLTATGDIVSSGTNTFSGTNSFPGTNNINGVNTFSGTTNFLNFISGTFQTLNDVLISSSGGTGINAGHGPGTHAGNYTNTLFGRLSGSAHTVAVNNSYFGEGVGGSMTTGQDNTAVGSQAMELSVSALMNTAHGYQALRSCNGNENTGIGSQALADLTDGNLNVGIGIQPGPSLTLGSRNILFGGKNTGLGIVDGNDNWIQDTGAGNVNVGNISNHVQFYRGGVLWFQMNDSNEYTIPLQTIALIDSAGNKAIVTKEYLDSRVTGTADSITTGTADSITTDTSNFNNNLSPADTDVQKALDTIDDLILSGAEGQTGDIQFNTGDELDASSAFNWDPSSRELKISQDQSPYAEGAFTIGADIGATLPQFRIEKIPDTFFSFTRISETSASGTTSGIEIQGGATGAGSGAHELRPTLNEQIKLGTQSLRWSEIHGKKLIGDTLAISSNVIIGATFDASAILNANSTGAGILIPRMTIAQRDAIVSPTTSLLLFNTDDGNFQFYTGSSWSSFSSLDSVNSYTKQQNFGITTLTAGANISWDADDNQSAKVTLDQNSTLSNMTNVVEGGSYHLAVNVSATPYTLSFGANYDFGDTGAPVLSTTASKVDRLSFQGTPSGKLAFIGIKKGFSE
jgi:hypothetical protein